MKLQHFALANSTPSMDNEVPGCNDFRSRGGAMNSAAEKILSDIMRDVGVELTVEQIHAKLGDAASKTDNVVGRMLNENPDEKSALAESYSGKTPPWESERQDSHEPRTVPDGKFVVFAESGSTVLYVVHSLLGRFKEMEENGSLMLRTNNNLAARLLLSNEIRPYLSSGYLEQKYHGIFPFFQQKTVNAADGRDQRQKLFEFEREQFAQCRLDLSPCRTLMLAASRLSLLFGPIVGSRENAIFKNATYNACVPSLKQPCKHAISLFVTPQKIVGHSDKGHSRVEDNHWNKKANGEKGDRPTQFHALSEELLNIDKNKCFAAFDFVNDSTLRRSPFSRNLTEGIEEERLKDGTSAVRMGAGRFRICRTWVDLFTKGGLSVNVFLHCSNETQQEWVDTEVEYAQKNNDSLSLETSSKDNGFVGIRISAR